MELCHVLYHHPRRITTELHSEGERTASLSSLEVAMAPKNERVVLVSNRIKV